MTTVAEVKSSTGKPNFCATWILALVISFVVSDSGTLILVLSDEADTPATSAATLVSGVTFTVCAVLASPV